MKNDKLLVRKIKDGIVIDHLHVGIGIKVLTLLGIDPNTNTVVVASGVESKKMGKKDIVKIENLWPDENILKLISLISPNATVNFIKDWKIVRKQKVELPQKVVGLVKCPNEKCVTNDEKEKKHLKTSFTLVDKKYLMCDYCEHMISLEEVTNYVRIYE
ncbi:MAG: aspartate carbamoyltransferase regulatory subunit [Candidatus Aenigmarchaeota archaeon]|nr:aspartate carbamoyltransferase regulatory subunit [Candidatus Aenigmarchaeota archaeon]